MSAPTLYVLDSEGSPVEASEEEIREAAEDWIDAARDEGYDTGYIDARDFAVKRAKDLVADIERL